MGPALSPGAVGQEMAACAVLGGVLGAARAVLPTRGRAAFLPDMLFVGAVLMALQSYAVSQSQAGQLRGYMALAAFCAAGAVQAIRTLDDTRLVDEASGWYDQGGGDVYSLHNYFYPLRVRPQTRTVALSEYGGIAWPMPGHEPPRKTYGYGTAKSREELTARYKKMQLGTVLPQLQKGLSALVYTQLTDVEDEVNGLFTYDRTAIKPDAAAVRAVNEALEAEFEKAVKA